MPFCPNCGKQVDEDARFCPYCSHRLSEEKVSGDIWSGIGIAAGIIGGIILILVSAVLYVYASNLIASIQSCLNGFFCSLGSYLAGNRSQLEATYNIALFLEYLAVILGVASISIIGYELYEYEKQKNEFAHSGGIAHTLQGVKESVSIHRVEIRVFVCNKRRGTRTITFYTLPRLTLLRYICPSKMFYL